MADPVNAAAVAAKQDEVKSLVRRLAEAVSESTEVMARFELENALAGRITGESPEKKPQGDKT